MNFSERLKPIEGFPNYKISSEGRVFNRLGQELKQFKNNHGYSLVYLSKNNHVKANQVHRLVAKAFIPNPENKLTINHIDGNKTNNDVSNLEWNTHSENLQHAYDTHLRKSILTPEIQKMGGLKTKSVTQKSVLVVELNKVYPCLRDCAADLGCQPSAISRCCNGEAKSHHGYHFKWI